MQSLSRVSKYRKNVQQQMTGLMRIAWLLFALAVPVIFLWVKLPAGVEQRQLQALIFFALNSVMLLIYLASFISVGSYREWKGLREHRVPQRFIVLFWGMAVLCYFLVWLDMNLGLLLYPYGFKVGVAFSTGGLLFTVAHYLSFYALFQEQSQESARELQMGRRRRAFQILEQCFDHYESMKRLSREQEEIKKLMRWNGFDRLLEEKIQDIEGYWKQERFSESDVEQLVGTLTWMNHLMNVMKQHSSFDQTDRKNSEQ